MPLSVKTMSYRQILWTRHDQAACFFSPSVNVTPAITSPISSWPLSRRQRFSADWHKRNTIARHARRLPLPLVRRGPKMETCRAEVRRLLDAAPEEINRPPNDEGRSVDLTGRILQAQE